MKRLLLLPLLFVVMMLSAKTGRIPSYMSFVYWIQGTDTLYEENNTLLHESVSPDGTVTIRVRHEDWRNIVTDKSLLRLAPWHAAVSKRRGIRAIIHQGQSNTDAMMPMKKVPGLMPNSLRVQNLSNEVDRLDMSFATEYMIENTGNQEIVINDLNRGLVWYVPADSYLLLNMGKLPQACLLRIANTDPLHPAVKYVTIGSASFSMKFTVAYEDEECWIFLVDEKKQGSGADLDFSRMLSTHSEIFRTHYIKRDKDTFKETPMVEAEVFAIIKEAKEREKKLEK